MLVPLLGPHSISVLLSLFYLLSDILFTQEAGLLLDGKIHAT